MQRLLKKSKMLLITLVSVSAISCVSNAPKPPYIELNLHDASTETALCTDSNGNECRSTPMSETDNWYMLQPKYFESIQNYIDLLKCKIDGGCASVMVNEPQVDISTQIDRIQRRLNKVKRSLNNQRSN